jgi:beta-N-acetylhexosaminidase
MARLITVNLHSGTITRRRFLAALGGGAAAVVLAACGVERSAQPTPTGSASPSATLTPTDTPSLEPSATLGPSLRDRIAQMLLVGFRGLTVEGAGEIVSDIQDRNLGGVVLFDTDQPTHSKVRNVESPAQLTALISGLQSLATTPLLVAIDEEGGLVARLDQRHGFPPTISAADLGARGDVAFTQAAGTKIAQTLASVGVNLNLAPVVDLNVNPTNPIIGSLGRSFSADPAVVTSQAEAFIEGHRSVGVLTTLKHFPGHGSSTGDTHLGVVDVTDTWSDVELEPFRNVVDDRLADAVLTAHVFNSKLDPQHPATLSQPTITGILREQIGWDGVVISDDMQMGAIRQAYGYKDALRLAILAGVDVLTIAQQQVYEPGIVASTIDLIEGLVNDGSLTEARIDQSYQRIQALKER